jgi:ABC-type sugar transport system substrate-binding protein
MAARKVVLLLASSKNDYQQELRDEGVAAAAQAGFEIEVFFAGTDPGRISIEQSHQIYQASSGDPTKRPYATIIFPLIDIGVVAKDVAKAQVGVVVIGRLPDFITGLRAAHPTLPIFAVSPDQVAAGRLQGRQLRSLLPGGGLVLSVLGSRLAQASTDRGNGLREALAGSAIRVETTAAAWTAESAEEAVAKWVRQPWKKEKLSAIACQNDAMAVGTRAAIKALSAEPKFAYLQSIPILGIDGSQALGRKMVDSGELAATVVMPAVSRTAIELLARSLKGEAIPAFVTIEPTSYPAGLAAD